MVAGAEDVLKEKGYAEELAARIPDGRAIVYENCGHAPNIEMAARFNADLLAFLGETYPSS
jgi:pimeloyl-ACP methyl ester carboxylesterase